MSIYYTKGIQNSRLFLYDDNKDKFTSTEPFEFFKEFPAVETKGMDIKEFKKNHDALLYLG